MLYHTYKQVKAWTSLYPMFFYFDGPMQIENSAKGHQIKADRMAKKGQIDMAGRAPNQGKQDGKEGSDRRGWWGFGIGSSNPHNSMTVGKGRTTG